MTMDHSDLFKAASTAGAAKQQQLLQNLVHKRMNAGAAMGAVAGAALGARSGAKEDRKAGLGKHTKAIARGVVGGVLGGGAGGAAGALSAYPRVVKSRRVAGGIGKEPFWRSIPEEHRNKIRGIATHAKRTKGPEGDTAREILRSKAKQHGFSFSQAIKHANMSNIPMQHERGYWRNWFHNLVTRNIEKTATSTRKALSAMAERIKRTDDAGRGLGDSGRARKNEKRLFDKVMKSKAERRMMARSASSDWAKTMSLPHGDRSGLAHMEERARRRLAAHLARKHGGKIVAGLAAGGAATVAGAAAVAHAAMKKHREKSKTKE